MTERQLKIAQKLVSSKNGAQMRAWCKGEGVSRSELGAAMYALQRVACENKLKGFER